MENELTKATLKNMFVQLHSRTNAALAAASTMRSLLLLAESRLERLGLGGSPLFELQDAVSELKRYDTLDADFGIFRDKLLAAENAMLDLIDRLSPSDLDEDQMQRTTEFNELITAAVDVLRRTRERSRGAGR